MTAEEEVYFWNPPIHWRINQKNIVINNVKVSREFMDTFLKIYSISQTGISTENIADQFSAEEQEQAEKMVACFIEKGILRNTINTPNEIFEMQMKILHSRYSPDYFFFQANIEEFTRLQLKRNKQKRYAGSIAVDTEDDIPAWIISRHSTRCFDTERAIEASTFKRMFNIFRQESGGSFFYPSAGGLYPVNLYVFIKAGRVEEWKAGLYYYNPYYNALDFIRETSGINEDNQYFKNKQIFQTSACTFYFTYNGEVNMPKYDGEGYFYGILDCGIMVGLLENYAEYLGLGSCSIGKMDFDHIKMNFPLSKNEVYLHSVEIGYKASIL